MRARSLAGLLRWLPAIALFLCVGLANATGNFLAVPLPKDVTVELPRNWTALSDNQRITIDSWVQAKREMGGASDPSSDLVFAANYYDERGKTAVGSIMELGRVIADDARVIRKNCYKSRGNAE